MAKEDSVRFWQSAVVAPAFVGAYLKNGRPALHVHEEWQFAVVEIPSRLSLGAFRRFGAGECDVTVVPSYEVHAEGGGVDAAPGWRALYVASSVITGIYGAVPRFRAPVLADPPAAFELRDLLRAGEQTDIAGSELEAAARHWLQRLLLLHAGDATGTELAPAVERARVYLQERPTAAVSLPEVGVAAGVTTSHLVRAFSREVGLPPKSYHVQVRLAHAQRLLAEGKSATWVAYECGFADQSHLSRHFKQSHGLTPRAFQAQIRDTSHAA